MKVICPFLAFVCWSCSVSYESVNFPDGWSVKEAPRDYSSDSWTIRKTDNGLKADCCADPPNVISYPINGGTLIGIDHGEFGGALRWVPNNDMQRASDILQTNVKNIFQWDGNIYVLTGLAHLSNSSGNMYRLDHANDTWQARHILDIGDAPYASTITPDGKLYIVSAMRLIRVQDSDVMQTIIDNAYWNGRYPTSLIIQDGFAVIGMRGGIAKIDLDTLEFTWYVK